MWYPLCDITQKQIGGKYFIILMDGLWLILQNTVVLNKAYFKATDRGPFIYDIIIIGEGGHKPKVDLDVLDIDMG